MNFQNLNFGYVERPRLPEAAFIPRSPRTPSDQSPTTSQHTLRPEDYASSRPATPSQPTVIPYAPTPPSPPSSASDIYGPDRLFGPPLLLHQSNAFGPPTDQPLLSIDEIQSIALQTAFAGQMAFAGQSYKDQLALEAGKVTPGVDDTPYIQYALEVLTRDRDTGYSHQATTSSNGDGDPFFRRIPDDGLGYYAHQVAVPPAPAAFPGGDHHHHRRSQYQDPIQDPVDHQLGQRRQRPPTTYNNPHHIPSPNSSLSTLVPQQQLRVAQQQPVIPKDGWVLKNRDGFTRPDKMAYPNPNFRPAILRPTSMITLMTLCILMITALLLSAIYSRLHHGLVDYDGSMSGRLYFVFRILPQILAGIVVLHAQCVITAMFRILPFSRMEGISHPDPADRDGAIFEDLYPKSYLWPRLVGGTWQTWVPCLVTWLMNFAIPLQSSLFTVILVDGKWRWATVQGVAWTLVVLYLTLAASTGILLAYWWSRKTGLIWDPRSIADFIALATNSDVSAAYRGTELMATRAEMATALDRRAVDKLGYWGWSDNRTRAVWHGMAADWQDTAWLDRTTDRRSQAGLGGGKEGVGVDVDVEALPPHPAEVRYRYLPWCLRNSQILYFLVTGCVLLIALLIISFLPSTDIRRGFLPGASVAPDAVGAFSAADFLYSFLPALLGQILWLLFQSLDMSLRILQPWAELQRHNRSLGGGARPEPSILADYAACLPLQSSWHAARNGHWRVAAVSLLATALVLLPALAGGIFTALTLVPTGEVRMLPNIPCYAVVLALLVLYVLALASLLPGRRAFRLPHAVTSIAEIVSLCANDDLMADDAFHDVRYKTTLRGKIGVDRAPSAQPLWVLGLGSGGSDDRLGVRRARVYTQLEKRTSRRQRRVYEQQVGEQREREFQEHMAMPARMHQVRLQGRGWQTGA